MVIMMMMVMMILIDCKEQYDLLLPLSKNGNIRMNDYGCTQGF